MELIAFLIGAGLFYFAGAIVQSKYDWPFADND